MVSPNPTPTVSGLRAESRRLKAFNRLDSARSPETVGVGLGLTIARDIVRNHGGDIFLSRSPLGGLRALIQIPI